MISPTICTQRLTLRNFEIADTREVVAIWADPEGGRYMADARYESAQELADALGDMAGCPIYYFVASLTGKGEIMGTCSIGPERKDPDTWGIGYTVQKDHWGNGYAVEMVEAMLAFARGFGIRTIVSPVAQANKASNRVMEKCGFHIRQESSFQKQGTDIVFPSYIYQLRMD